jgi:hypothetical protein
MGNGSFLSPSLSDTGDAARSFIERHAEVLETTLRTPPDPKGIWLVRPDGYIAAVTKNGDLSMIEKSLARFAN